MRDGRWDADKIICPIRITGVPYYDDKSVVACLRLSVHLQKGQYEAYKRWGRMQMIYNNKAYESVAEDYHSLHDKLKHKPEFLFEEAQCLSKTGQHAEAIRVLERAKRLSGDR